MHFYYQKVKSVGTAIMQQKHQVWKKHLRKGQPTKLENLLNLRVRFKLAGVKNCLYSPLKKINLRGLMASFLLMGAVFYCEFL